MAKTKTTKPAPPPTENDIEASPAEYDDGKAIAAPPPLAVPGKVRPAMRSIKRSLIWLYGPQKIGKTTTMSHFPGLWCVATEPGQDWVEIRQPTLIHSWEHFLEFCAFIEETKPTHFEDGEPIQWIGIDTVDLLFRMCVDDICRQLQIEDPSELGHGKAWARLSAEFERVFTKIRRWPFGMLCLSHARDKMQLVRGQQKTKIEPDIGAAGMRCISAAADLILYMHSDSVPVTKEDGTLTGQIEEVVVCDTRPSSSIVAGGRMAHLLPQRLVLDREDPYGHLNELIQDGGTNK